MGKPRGGNYHWIDNQLVRATRYKGKFTDLVEKDVTVEEVNQAFVSASENPLYKGKLVTTTEPLVSSDIVGNPASAIVDLSLTQVVDGNFVKIIAWYDNEFGYSNRLVEQTVLIGVS